MRRGSGDGLCALLVLCGMLSVNRAGAAPPTVGSTRQPIIYGEDDRTEVYASPSQRLRDLARRSVLALIPAHNLVEDSDGSFVPAAGALSDVRLCPNAGPCVSMCPDEPFIDQPSIADCSGVLVDDDLVLSAGHCFSDERSCAAYAYVFDFYYRAPDELARIDPEDVYGCRRIVRQELSDQPGQESQDYALIQLDRPVGEERLPVELRSESLREGDRVSAIGFAVGLPAKVDGGGVVQEARAPMQDFFTATTDTYVGNSGSPIFDDQGRLTGHLVLGGQDFQPSVADGEECLRSVVVPDGAMPPLYEHSVYPEVWRKELCDRQWPSERLCGAHGDGCGDGVCAGKESEKACSTDCGAPLCSGPDCLHQAALLPEFEGSPKGGRCTVSAVPAGGLSLSFSWGALVLWLAWRRRRLEPC